MDEEEKRILLENNRILKENNEMLKELLDIARKHTSPEYINQKNFNDFLLNANANLFIHELIKKIWAMKVKLKDGRVLPIEEGSLIALNNNGDTFEVNVEDINSFIDNKINWEQRRYETAKELLAAFMSNSCSNVFGGEKIREIIIEAKRKMV